MLILNCLIHADVYIYHTHIHLYLFICSLQNFVCVWKNLPSRSFEVSILPSLNYKFFFFNESVNIRLFYWLLREFFLRNFVIAGNEYDLHKLKGWLERWALKAREEAGDGREDNRGEEGGSLARIEISGDRPRFYSVAFPRSGLIHRAVHPQKLAKLLLTSFSRLPWVSDTRGGRGRLLHANLDACSR